MTSPLITKFSTFGKNLTQKSNKYETFEEECFQNLGTFKLFVFESKKEVRMLISMVVRPNVKYHLK